MRDSERKRGAQHDAVSDLFDRWEVPAKAVKTRKLLRRLLDHLVYGMIYVLREQRLQVAVVPGKGVIWAYFPAHKRRAFVRLHRIQVRPEARIVLVIPEAEVEGQPEIETLVELAHHFGHVLCYLENPGRIHECPDADKSLYGALQFSPRGRAFARRLKRAKKVVR